MTAAMKARRAFDSVLMFQGIVPQQTVTDP